MDHEDFLRQLEHSLEKNPANTSATIAAAALYLGEKLADLIREIVETNQHLDRTAENIDAVSQALNAIELTDLGDISDHLRSLNDLSPAVDVIATEIASISARLPS